MIALENPHKSKGWTPNQINGNRIYVDNLLYHSLMKMQLYMTCFQ